MKINVDYIGPPIPIRTMDYSATWDDYDGAEDSSNRGHVGYGSTRDEAIADLIENYPREEESDAPDQRLSAHEQLQLREEGKPVSGL